jgi:hypothetical protein
VNEENGDLVPLTDELPPHEITGIDTYAGHRFEIRVALADDSMSGVQFTKANVNENIEIRNVNNVGLVISHQDDSSRKYIRALAGMKLCYWTTCPYRRYDRIWSKIDNRIAFSQ